MSYDLPVKAAQIKQNKGYLLLYVRRHGGSDFNDTSWNSYKYVAISAGEKENRTSSYGCRLHTGELKPFSHPFPRVQVKIC